VLAAGREFIQNELIFGFSFGILEIMLFKAKRTQGTGSIQDAVWGLLVFPSLKKPFSG